MPSNITAYRVFIASPGGLQPERDRFRAALHHHNESDAIERGVMFLPVGWEITLGGVGRPQALIDEDVKRCDYFVMLLWDKWGSSPLAQPGAYTSGSHEEYNVALDCYHNGTMREIVVMFKDIAPEKLADPGPQLAPVLEFKEQLEREKKLLFETFDTLDVMEKNLQRHLARWVRDHEQGFQRSPDDPLMVSTLTGVRREGGTSSAPPPSATSSEPVRRAEELSKQGRLTEAEGVLAGAVAKADDLEAMHRYGALLLASGSLSKAEALFHKIRERAQQLGMHEWQVSGENNLAKVYLAKGKPELAEASYRRALEVKVASLGPDHPSVADSWTDLADLYAQQNRYQEAEECYRRALSIQGVQLAS